VVIETVKRLATRVSARSINHDSNPALVKNGNLTVEINADKRSNKPRAEMLAKSNELFQFFGRCIRSDLTEPGYSILRLARAI